MHARGHEVAIVHRATGTAGLVKTQREQITIYRVELGAMDTWSLFVATFGNPRLVQKFREVFEEFRPDVVHFQHLRGLSPRLVHWSKQQGSLVFISLRDFWFVCPNAQLLDYETGELCETPGEPIHCTRCGLVRVGYRALLPIAPILSPIMAVRNHILSQSMQQADALFAYTRFVQNWYTQQGAPAEKLHYVPRGIPRPAKPPVEFHDDDYVRFAYIGGLSWQKGIHVLIEAFNTLDEHAKLLIAGDETQYVEYVGELRTRVQHPGVEFLGRIDREVVWNVLACADAVVIPSLWYETFSMLAREAFAMGVPVIASNHGALAEAVTHEVDGLLVPPGDVSAWRLALRRFVDSYDLRTHLRAGVSAPLTMREYLDNLEVHYTQDNL
jgi:glycosyltransferase involved in cell wall biosynthesis